MRLTPGPTLHHHTHPLQPGVASSWARALVTHLFRAQPRIFQEPSSCQEPDKGLAGVTTLIPWAKFFAVSALPPAPLGKPWPVT